MKFCMFLLFPTPYKVFACLFQVFSVNLLRYTCIFMYIISVYKCISSSRMPFVLFLLILYILWPDFKTHFKIHWCPLQGSRRGRRFRPKVVAEGGLVRLPLACVFLDLSSVSLLLF